MKNDNDECMDRGGDHAGMKFGSAQPLSRSERRRQVAGRDDVQQALLASGILARTDPCAASDLSKQLEPVLFPPESSVGDRPDSGRCLYVIISGRVKVSYRRSDGCEIVLAVLGRAEIFGATELFDPDSQAISATTLTQVLAVPIERGQLLMWMVEHPEITDQVLRLFARRAKAVTNSLVDFAFADTQSRIAAWLLLFKKRFGRQEDGVVRVVHDLTLEEFSLFVGIAPEIVGATLREFEDRGWVRLNGGSMVIVDGQALMSVRG